MRSTGLSVVILLVLGTGACVHVTPELRGALAPPKLYVEIPGGLPPLEEMARQIDIVGPLVDEAFGICKVHLVQGFEERYVECMKKKLGARGLSVYTQEEYDAIPPKPQGPGLPAPSIT